MGLIRSNELIWIRRKWIEKFHSKSGFRDHFLLIYKMEEEDELSLKFIVIGASGGGKTSILRRLVDDKFIKGTQSTIGIEYFTYVTTIENQQVRLLLWDTAGQERFYTIAKAYFRNALGIILVYDICDRKSYESLPRWLRDATLEADPHNTAILVGNKVDRESERVVSREEAEQFSKLNHLQYAETSALANIGIQEVFLRTATKIVQKIQTGEIQLVKPGQSPPAVKNEQDSKKCCK